MCTKERVQFMYKSVESINARGVEGDIVEAGVYKGGMSLAMALSQIRFGTNRRFWLYDTYEGMPAPGAKDDAIAHETFENASRRIYDTTVRGSHFEGGKWCWGPLWLVQWNMMKTGYPADKLKFIKGKVEETL